MTHIYSNQVCVINNFIVNRILEIVNDFVLITDGQTSGLSLSVVTSCAIVKQKHWNSAVVAPAPVSYTRHNTELCL